MPKKIIEDIKIKKVKINEILAKDINFDVKPSTPESNILIKKSDNIYTPKFDDKKRLHSTPQIKTGRKSSIKSLTIILLIILVLVSIYSILNMFIRANIEVVAKHQSFSLSNKEYVTSKSLDSSIHFENMIVPTENTKDTILTQTQDVSIKAKGNITLFNEYSTKDQKIPAGTFLADTSGKTYITDSSVTIPGYKTDKITKETTPGTVDLSITAFLPGENYNGTPSNLTITSFKGTTKAKKIYAKTTTPISGGAQGIVYVLGDEEKANLSKYAESTFKDDLIKKAEALVPKGYILYPNAYDFSYNINDDILSQDPKAKITISGSLSSIILKEDDLSTAIIKSLLPNISDSELAEIKTPDISNLVFNFTNQDLIINKDLKSVSFNLTGTANFIWNPSIENLKTNLMGISKNNILPIFKQDPGIVTASVNIFPPWQTYIPFDISKISITTKQ